jgi:hypothetical protein
MDSRDNDRSPTKRGLTLLFYQRQLCAITLVIASFFFNPNFASAKDHDKPHVVIVVGTLHYSPELTMPAFAKELERFGFRTTVVMGEGDPEKKLKNVLPGIDALVDADLAIFFMRFLKLPDSEWQPIEDYIKSGRPAIGLRTACHSFKYPSDHPRFSWHEDPCHRRSPPTPNLVKRHQDELGIGRDPVSDTP